MGKDITAQDLEAVVTHRLAGRSWEDTLRETGVSHSIAERAMWVYEWHVAEGHEPLVIDASAEGQANIVALRRYFGWSWGRIACAGQRMADELRPAFSEGKVKSTFQAATGLSPKGQRNGHGGRFLQGDPLLYTDTLRGTGTDLTPEQVRDIEARREAAREQGLVQRPIAELRAQAKELGLRTTTKDTPAQIAKRIQKALASA